ncbi:protein translocase subunit yidC [Desulfonispora thiosulfatigenes DSM 11270]|uniref:Protein translocase subunit yidC n=1 Tax=Desulfonispora thiosulfatigenes DSM 11270 TaxID=656914 RepID=A0A1W1V3A2_DESTI|nr:protein translocase subunit yidC [Desulfonispora thiosulfatigenes DSM 11270]
MWNGLVNGVKSIINLLYGFTDTLGVPSYALAIIILTVLLKLALYPLTVKQMTSMKGMQEIQPKVQALQKKYKNDKEKLNKAVMELYQEYNVNPIAGCLPMIVQMPILIALFTALRDFDFVHAAHASFFWIDSLSNPDPYYILPVLVGVATFFQSKLTTPQGGANQQNMALMLYFMPIFIGWISMKFPAGLGLYWVVFNTLGVVQQLIINKKPLAKKGEVSGK